MSLEAMQSLGRPAPSIGLPTRMRVLYIAAEPRSGEWLAAALASDRATCVTFVEAVGLAEGIERLRHEIFDAVLVRHEPGVLDGLEFLEGLRTGGSEEPLILLGAQSEQAMAPLCYEIGADAYVCIDTTTTRALLWILARALEHQRLRRENRRLAQAERHRLRLEHAETERLLNEQRALIRDLESLADTPPAQDTPPAGSALAALAQPSNESEPPLPTPLVEHYRELLRTYIIMGSGSLSDEMTRLGGLLAAAGVSAPQTVNMHLAVVEDLLRGLGSRSARHVLSRADLLLLEMLVHLVENYRPRRLDGPGAPPVLPRQECDAWRETAA